MLRADVGGAGRAFASMTCGDDDVMQSPLDPDLRRYNAIGWPCGVRRAASSHSSLRWRSRSALTIPFRAAMRSSAVNQCS